MGKPKSPKQPKEKIEYWKADEGIEALGRALIAKYHSHLVNAKVCYLFRTKAKEKGSQVVLGTASRLNGKMQALADFDFIIEIGHDKWQDLNPTQREALIDHELCHCGGTEDEQTGEMKYSILPHDLEEFQEIVGRYGFWKQGIKDFVKAVPLDPEAVPPKVITAVMQAAMAAENK